MSSPSVKIKFNSVGHSFAAETGPEVKEIKEPVTRKTEKLENNDCGQSTSLVCVEGKFWQKHETHLWRHQKSPQYCINEMNIRYPSGCLTE